MRVVWSETAREDRHQAVDYIAERNIRAAIDVDERIAAIQTNLEQFPQSGRPGRMTGTREYVVSGTPYLAIYAIEGNKLTILRVLHGARAWPPQD